MEIAILVPATANTVLDLQTIVKDLELQFKLIVITIFLSAHVLVQLAPSIILIIVYHVLMAIIIIPGHA